MSDVSSLDQKQHQTPVVLTQGTCLLKGWSDAVNITWFDPERFELHARPVADGGRGRAWYVDVAGQPGVLRQYRRGGLIARLSRDLYWWTGRDQTRSFREFDILAELAGMSDQGLNVPRPVAAMACRTGGLCYRAALITQRIDQAESFWKHDDGLVWERAGEMIARLHRVGVWHADLNVNNILVDSHEKIWLIDFDRARTGVTNPKRLYGNLQRLERSVRKVCPERIHDCWPMLLTGYARAPD